jgi:thiosulfate dehydrogenase (quinone) large subunit
MGVKSGHSEARLHSAPDTKWRDVALAVGRIAVGGYWLYEQHWKLPPDFGLHQPRGLMFAFQQGIQYPTLDVYKTFLQDVVVPNFYLFGWLLFVGEMTIGTSLTLGLLTRAGALLGTVQAVNLLLAQGSTPEGPWIYLAILGANIVVLLTPSNRQLSVDRLLAPKLAESASRGSLLARILLWMM